MAPYDIVIRRDPLRVCQPDLIVVNSGLMGIASPSDLLGRCFLDSSPLLVVEVLSPSNTPPPPATLHKEWLTTGASECRSAGWPDSNDRSGVTDTGIRHYGMGDGRPALGGAARLCSSDRLLLQ